MWPLLPNACTLIIILLLVQPSLQTTFPTEHYSSCLSRLQSYCNSTTPPITGGNCTDAILNGLLDGNGNRALNVNSATAIRFSLCELECGRSQLPFSWAIFSQQFSAWLLPFLALISQLPFGARHRLDNLTSMFLAVGSPTMAAYSLAITVLNSRWIKHRFDAVRYRNAGLAVKILPNLQYSPVRVHCTTFLLSSLIILRENDGWWSELNQRIHYKRTWSIAAAASIIWVVIAYAFTVILSIGNLKSQVGSNGQSVGTVWLWLIPVVVGWQQLSPKSDHDHLKEIFDHVNGLAYVASPAGVVKASSQGLLRAISIDAFFSNTLFFLDENRSPPIFNYARFLSWSQSAQIICDAFRNASLHASLKASPVAETGREPLIGDMGSMDTYCGISERRAKSRRKWASGIVPRMVMASTVALALQWGTTGASIIGEILSPTTGLGCRSLGYLIYGSISTLVWMLLITSSLLAHYAFPLSPFSDPFASPLHEDPPLSHRMAATIADGLCGLGKILAVLNTIVITTVGIFQFSNMFDRCYCSASVLGRGKSAAFVTVDVDSSFVETGWIGGLVLASSVCIGFIFFVNLMRHS